MQRVQSVDVTAARTCSIRCATCSRSATCPVDFERARNGCPTAAICAISRTGGAESGRRKSHPDADAGGGDRVGRGRLLGDVAKPWTTACRRWSCEIALFRGSKPDTLTDLAPARWKPVRARRERRSTRGDSDNNLYLIAAAKCGSWGSSAAATACAIATLSPRPSVAGVLWRPGSTFSRPSACAAMMRSSQRLARAGHPC